MHNPNWDDLRHVLAVARHGSLLRAAKALGVEHTTVGRRVAAAEAALGARLFARSPAGLVLTAEGERLIDALRDVEAAVAAVERRAAAERGELVGRVNVTAPETFGMAWLAPRLAVFAAENPGLEIALDPAGAVRDLSRSEAEVAVRYVPREADGLVVRRLCDIASALYAAPAWLAAHPVRGPADLAGKALLAGPPGDPERAWLARLTGDATPTFMCDLSVALASAARAGAGIAVLPRFVGDVDPGLVRVPMPDEPRETLWLTVHRDLRDAPRVRAVMDLLVAAAVADRAVLCGA
jgi:DNA-binding transcriptional LysR family regulator